MKDYKYTVYMHTFPDSKSYVGITMQDIKARWGSYGQCYKNQPVYEAIQKFGWNNIKHEIIAEGLSMEDAQKLEQKLIEKYQAQDLSYNIGKGGDCGSIPWCKYEYNGKIYTAEELAKLSKVKNLTDHDITTRLNQHKWTMEKTLNKEKTSKNKKYFYKGNYYTIKELYDFVKPEHVTYNQLITRLTQHNWDLERAITQPNNKKKQPFGISERRYEYQGQMYNSYELCQLSDVEGLTVADITCRINHHGWTVEKAITQPKRKRVPLYKYEGKTYTAEELAKICASSDLDNSTINARRRKGWTTWEIVNIPKGMTRKQFYRQFNKNPQANQQPSLSNPDNSRQEGSETNS